MGNYIYRFSRNVNVQKAINIKNSLFGAGVN